MNQFEKRARLEWAKTSVKEWPKRDVPRKSIKIGGATFRQVRVNSAGGGKELRIVTYGRSREPGGSYLAGEIKPCGV